MGGGSWKMEVGRWKWEDGSKKVGKSEDVRGGSRVIKIEICNV